MFLFAVKPFFFICLALMSGMAFASDEKTTFGDRDSKIGHAYSVGKNAASGKGDILGKKCTTLSFNKGALFRVCDEVWVSGDKSEYQKWLDHVLKASRSCLDEASPAIQNMSSKGYQQLYESKINPALRQIKKILFRAKHQKTDFKAMIDSALYDLEEDRRRTLESLSEMPLILYAGKPAYTCTPAEWEAREIIRQAVEDNYSVLKQMLLE